MEAPLLTVVIPSRNEAENVVPLLSRLRSALTGLDFEVIFVDDSDDGTAAALTSIAARDPRVDMVHREGQERAGGLSAAVVSGLHLARGELVCVMDADLQHPPETIPSMIAAIRGGADLVVASRYTTGGSGGGLEGFGRRLVSRGAGMVARLLFTEARQSSDPLSGFFVCRRRLLDGIEFRPVGFKILLELLVCVPGLRVRDVPLRFAPRTAGGSKASFRQGLLFAGHLRSLVFDVQGSARPWKFGLVGLTGLAVLLPLIAVLTGPVRMAPLSAFIPAFLLSLLWNGVLNRRWTFADQRHGSGDGAGRYLRRGLLSGLAMFAAYAGLLALGWGPVPAVLGAALLAMVLNGLANRAAVRRAPRSWSAVATGDRLQVALGRLRAELGADRCYVLPPQGAAPASLPPGILDRVVGQRRGALFSEAAGHRTQRRSNIAVTSTLVVPVVADFTVHAVLVCERTAPQPFGAADLEAAIAASTAMVQLLDSAAESAAPTPGEADALHG